MKTLKKVTITFPVTQSFSDDIDHSNIDYAEALANDTSESMRKIGRVLSYIKQFPADNPIEAIKAVYGAQIGIKETVKNKITTYYIPYLYLHYS